MALPLISDEQTKNEFQSWASEVNVRKINSYLPTTIFQHRIQYLAAVWRYCDAGVWVA
jgi:hypothetical protein